MSDSDGGTARPIYDYKFKIYIILLSIQFWLYLALICPIDLFNHWLWLS